MSSFAAPVGSRFPTCNLCRRTRRDGKLKVHKNLLAFRLSFDIATFMDKETAFQRLLDRCFAARLPISEVCDRAKVSRGTVTRWRASPDTMSPRTLGRLEAVLDAIEKSRG